MSNFIKRLILTLVMPLTLVSVTACATKLKPVAPSPCQISVPSTFVEPVARPAKIGIDGLRGLSTVDDALTFALDREQSWEAAFTLSEARSDALIGLIADGNRCTLEARRSPAR